MKQHSGTLLSTFVEKSPFWDAVYGDDDESQNDESQAADDDESQADKSQAAEDQDQEGLEKQVVFSAFAVEDDEKDGQLALIALHYEEG